MDDDDLVSCPFCAVFFPASEVQEHVQLHFLEEQPAPQQQTEEVVVDDEELEERVHCPYGCGAMVALHELDSHEEAHRLQELESQHISLQQEEFDRDHEQLQMRYGFIDKRPGKCHHCGEEGHWAMECPQNAAAAPARPRDPLSTTPSQLAQLQQPDGNAAAHSVDVIPLLQACFEAQPKAHSMVYLSGPVGFHSGRGQADCGWGCGYRNIQMQASHLLLKGGPHRQALFGGCGFVPDIASLQAWLEVAWQAGFDPGGAAMFGSVVQGTRKWIGTTEAAALLRFFGCRALLVEFHGKPPPTSVDASGATIHEGVACDVCQRAPIIGIRCKSYQTPNYDVCGGCKRSPEAQKHAPFRAVGQKGRGTAAGTAAAAAAGGSGPSRNTQQPAVFNGSSGSKQGSVQRMLNGATASSSGRDQQQQDSTAAGSSDRNNPNKSSSDGSNKGEGARKGDSERHRPLAEWIWAYFSQGRPAAAQQPGAASSGAAAAAAGAGISSSGAAADDANRPAAAAGASGPSGPANNNNTNAFAKLMRRHSPVVVTDRPPLYLQHEGHSRTVVGIERCLPPHAQAQGGQPDYTLIVLDPGLGAGDLLNALRSRKDWQRRVKRGMHSLARQAEFQVLHVAPGIVPAGAQRDSLKKIAPEDVYR